MRRIVGPAAIITAMAMVLTLAAAPVASAAGAGGNATDPFMGQYEGTYTAPDGVSVRAEALVVGQSEKEYKVLLTTLPDDPEEAMKLELKGKRPGRLIAFLLGRELQIKGRQGTTKWKGMCDLGVLKARAKGDEADRFSLGRVFRVSPTQGMLPPDGAVVLLPYTKGEMTNLNEWTNKNWKLLPDGSAQVFKGDNRSVRKFGDCRLHAEFWLPYEPSRRGQGRGNSGVYLQDFYEVQVLDSFGLKPEKGDCGAIYSVAVPPPGVCFPPERWQTFDIEFRAPRFGPDGKVTERPIMTVYHNGVLTHKNVSIPRGTEKSKPGGEPKVGPIRLQDHGHPVRYRNIWLVERNKD